MTTNMFQFRRRSKVGILEAGSSTRADEHPLESGGSRLFTTAKANVKLLQGGMQVKLLGSKRTEILLRLQLYIGL
ncbi:hypothetical protein DHEL01_v211138 [Diaporthe helianthi]|uniref:Uncharacterized protein n=1 Tax=Diaporthe helianthi TaxID=158607 RepID=A0A2P5HJN9_DIAHE|nr:hypothetical protein DHEL01_v211138 [Diaporthe helianthi]